MLRDEADRVVGDSYTVSVRTRCRACAMALAGHASYLGEVVCIAVAVNDAGGRAGVTIHHNTAFLQSHDGSPFACPEHGKVLDLSRGPGPQNAKGPLPSLKWERQGP